MAGTPEVGTRVFISARSDSKLGSIIAAALAHQGVSVVYPAQDTTPSEIFVEQIRNRISNINAAILIIETADDDSTSQSDESELINEKLEIALRRIQELEISHLLSESDINLMKEYLTRIHRVLLASNKQLEQHKVKLGGVRKAFVDELIYGLSELVEEAVMIKSSASLITHSAKNS